MLPGIHLSRLSHAAKRQGCLAIAPPSGRAWYCPQVFDGWQNVRIKDDVACAQIWEESLGCQAVYIEGPDSLEAAMRRSCKTSSKKSVRVEPEIPCQTQKDRNARNRAAEQAQERGHRKDAKCPNVRHGVAGLKCSVWAFGLALVRPLHIPVLF